ncbi:MAG: hypothetical protein Q9160_004177 [Pyrenula sp. 1 TL-2023]
MAEPPPLQPPPRAHRLPPAPAPLPPPAPPLPPSRQASSRPGVLQRLVAPLGLGFGNRPPNVETNRSDSRQTSPNPAYPRTNVPNSSQKATHRTGIPIAALDISTNRQHAVLAGKEILKTVRVSHENVVEELNIRSTVTSYASTHGTDIESISASQNDYLAAIDVKWSHSQHDTIIATAANNGRIVLYDLRRPEVEWARLHEHVRPVHRLAFSPFGAQLFLSASQDATTRLWDLRTLSGEKRTVTMRSIRGFQSRADATRDVRWSPTDAYQFATCTDAGIISLWDIRHPHKVLNRLNAHEKACYALDWHPDGKHIVSAGLDRNVKVWEITNERRRQRPLLVMKAPSGVMNVRWRPASWSSEEQSTGDWQCSHLVTAYNQEDPRVHVWDLRRPLVPFREIDQYYSPPTDMLWRTKDLLWTVGNEGMFTQTDIQFSPETAKQTSPCPRVWLPNGCLWSFSESVSRRRSSGIEELFELPKEKGSSEEKTGTSHSMTDDEANPDNFMTSLKKRQVKPLWSQDNTPPSRDERVSVLNLEQTLEKRDNELPQQVGMTIDLDTVSLDISAFNFLAEQYVKPMSADELRRRPNKILARLEQVFSKNAEICDNLLLHRSAQSWRILGFVLVEDLRLRADTNRQQRLKGASLKLPTNTSSSSHRQEEMTTKSESPQSAPRLDKSDSGNRNIVNGHGFTGGVIGLDRQKLAVELESTSNMTTPLARPVPDTPFSDVPRLPPRHHHYETSTQAPSALPQSLLHSHSTAAAASDALRGDSPGSTSPTKSSPELHQSQIRSQGSSDRDSSSVASSPRVNQPLRGKENTKDEKGSTVPGPILLTAEDGPEHNEEKRAALHDYRGQNRPILTFGHALDPSRSEGENSVFRHDSNESFPMFSTSTDSSFKARSLGESLESTGVSKGLDSSTRRLGRSTVEASSGSFESLLHPDRGQDSNPISFEDNYNSSRSDSGLDIPTMAEQTPPTLPFSLEGLGDTRPAPLDSSHEGSTKDYGTKANSLSVSLDESPMVRRQTSTARAIPSTSQPRLHRPPPQWTKVEAPQETRSTVSAEDDIMSTEFIYSDFETLQYVEDFPSGSFPWSPSRLLLSCLQADMRGQNGSTYCQFATQILFHVLPFYSSILTRGNRHTDPTNEADESISQPFLESIFSTYLEALKVHSLPVSAADVRNFCKDYGFQNAYEALMNDEEENHKDRGHFVFAACKSCAEPLGGRNSGAQCSVCSNVRDPCPICLSIFGASINVGRPELTNGGGDLWMHCQGCGHGGHMACMMEWLDLSDSEGSCPTPFCDHDCGPGAMRDQRVASFIKAEADANLVRGGSQSGAKTDSWVIPQSAAVGQTRAVLSGRAGSGSGGSLGRKQVRLVTPGEQSLP